MNILVLGVYVDERDPVGGILDTNKLDMNDPNHKALYSAIKEAQEDAKRDGVLVGSAGLDSQYMVWDIWEKAPFSGTIDEEIILYVE